MFDLAHLLAGALLVSLVAYAVFSGADYGGGVWDLFATPRQRKLIEDSIGPVWEANHVWLILAVVLLFTCFPPAFALVTTTLHVPLTLVLLGVMARGTAFTFRHYDVRDAAHERRWGTIFGVASLVTPLFLGVVVGAVATGRADGSRPGFILPWLTSPFAWLIGALALALFAMLAATYLAFAARDDRALADDFRRRALGAQLVATLLAFSALFLATHEAPTLAHALLRSPLALALHGGAAVAGVALAATLLGRRYTPARPAAAGLVALVVAGWAAAQSPWLVPNALDIAHAQAPAATLRPVLVALVAGVIVLVPSLVYLYRVFARQDRRGQETLGVKPQTEEKR